MRITELPGNICPFESDLRKRKAAAEAFAPASRVVIDRITGGTYTKPAPMKITKAPVTIQFQPSSKQLEFIERIIKSGECETPEEVVSAAVDSAMLQEAGL
jgi:hypothetical protein